MDKSKKIGFAVIGYGGMGSWHASTCADDFKDTAELIGIYDIKPERRAAAEADGIHAFSSREELLADDRIDLVTVATPNDVHKEIVIAAMAAGKNVISEKPVALSQEELEEMIAASRKTDSSIIDMTVTAGSPEEAYELAQAVKDTYKDVVQVYSGGSIHLCDMPELPTEPDKSVGITRNAIIGALAGAVICALIIIIRDSARNTVRSQEDIQNKLQLNVIGEVSQVPGGERFYKKSAHGDRKLLITDKACGFAFIETYKAMRTKLELLNGRRGYKSFVISSAGANEGKTTVAVNLSLALAQNGYSVLLIDADLRKPSVLKNLGITNISGNGIADVVSMVKNSSDAIKYIEKYKIFVLAGDECIADPTEVLSNAKTGEFIAAAKEKFDYIIIDTPPAGIVADAAICAKYTDSSIFVIREDRFPVPAILEAVSDLTQGGTDLAGCVYNISTDRSRGGYGSYSVSRRRYGYGYGRHYGYGYGKHYGYGYGYGGHAGSRDKKDK